MNSAVAQPPRSGLIKSCIPTARKPGECEELWLIRLRRIDRDSRPAAHAAGHRTRLVKPEGRRWAPASAHLGHYRCAQGAHHPISITAPIPARSPRRSTRGYAYRPYYAKSLSQAAADIVWWTGLALTPGTTDGNIVEAPVPVVQWDRRNPPRPSLD